MSGDPSQNPERKQGLSALDRHPDSGLGLADYGTEIRLAVTGMRKATGADWGGKRVASAALARQAPSGLAATELGRTSALEVRPLASTSKWISIPDAEVEAASFLAKQNSTSACLRRNARVSAAGS